MSAAVSPSLVYIYPVAPSNPAGNPTATVTLSGDTSYTAVSSNTSVATAAVSGSTLTITYVGPLPTPGTPITVTVTGSPSNTTATVSVYAYGPLTLAALNVGSSTTETFMASENGYAGALTASIDPPIATLSANSGVGPTLGPISITPISPGNAVVTIADDHGGVVQFLATITSYASAQTRATPLGYPTAGVWFDFLHPDEENLPTMGEIRGMPVTGAVSLRGPYDFGNFAWCSGLADVVAQFGVGFGDFANPIQVMFAGKSDFFDAELGDPAAAMVKSVDNVNLLVSVPTINQSGPLTFQGVVTADEYSAIQSYGLTVINASQALAGAVVGTAVVGQSFIASGQAASTYQTARFFAGDGSQGRVIQVGFIENSIFPWITLGYIININARKEISP